MPVINIKFAHAQTGTPLVEIRVDAATTIGTLKGSLEKRMAADEACPMRVWSSWHFKTPKNKKVQIATADSGRSVAQIGLQDESIVYLDGPMIIDMDGAKQAISTVSEQSSAGIAQLMVEFTALKERLTIVEKQNADQRKEINKLKQQVQQQTKNAKNGQKKQQDQITALSDQQAEQSETLSKINQELHQVSIASQHKHNGPHPKALELLAQYPNMPLKALWQALTDNKTFVGDTRTAMDIINDSACGIERKSVAEEGVFQKKVACLNKDKRGGTPLKLAILAERMDVVQALIADGANVKSAEDEVRDTPLHVAASCNNLPAIDALVAKGADLMAKNKHGNSPLHRAASCGNAEAIQKLLAIGATKTATSNDGTTPLKRFEEFNPNASEDLKSRVRQMLS